MTEPRAAVDLEAIEQTCAAATGTHDEACRTGRTSARRCPACAATREAGLFRSTWLAALIAEVRALRAELRVWAEACGTPYPREAQVDRLADATRIGQLEAALHSCRALAQAVLAWKHCPHGGACEHQAAAITLAEAWLAGEEAKR